MIGYTTVWMSVGLMILEDGAPKHQLLINVEALATQEIPSGNDMAMPQFRGLLRLLCPQQDEVIHIFCSSKKGIESSSEISDRCPYKVWQGQTTRATLSNKVHHDQCLQIHLWTCRSDKWNFCLGYSLVYSLKSFTKTYKYNSLWLLTKDDQHLRK